VTGVRVERPAERVAELVMDRPEALNAVSTAQAKALAAAVAEVESDDRITVVVLSSSSAKAFCVGADLKERRDFTDDDLRRQRPWTRAAYASVLGLPMPSIAAVEGYALGGGCELALSCDLVVASATAVFGLPEVGLGLIPGGGGTQLLTRRIGWNKAADLILTGRRVEATEADRLGLVDRATEPGQARAVALELAGRIAANSPVALRSAKHALREGFDVDLASALLIEEQGWERAAFSADRREGVAAFNERRAPRWPDPPPGRRRPE
jgi:enoyl-CoA hydratase/carnithine racemase